MVEIESDDDGRVAGSVTAAGGHPVPFSGWIELLHLLEPDSTHDHRPGTTPRGPAPATETDT